MNQENSQTKRAYGGRPLWQWILIYAVVGGLVYAGIYYFMAGRSASGYGQPTKASAQTSAPAQAQMQQPAQTPMQQPAQTRMQQPAQTPMQQSSSSYHW